jgi:hypothetical protein
MIEGYTGPSRFFLQRPLTATACFVPFDTGFLIGYQSSWHPCPIERFTRPLSFGIMSMLFRLKWRGQHYEIYFMLQRASGGETADLRLTVESAYPNGGFNVRKRPREIRFIVLAHKVLTNQRIHFAAR